MADYLRLGLKIGFLIVFMMFSFILASLLVGVRGASGGSLMPIVIYSIVNTLVLVLFILNSRYSGIKLMGLTAGLYWAIQFLMTQIETLYFIQSLTIPIDVVMKSVLSGGINAIVFSIVAVLLLKKSTKAEVKSKPVNLWLHKSVLISLLYVGVYFFFGYFVAFQFPGVREYYAASASVMNLQLVIFQALRGWMWFGIVLMMYKSWVKMNWQAYLIIGLMLGVLISSTLVFDNPYMPAAIRWAHFWELNSSMFTFGLISVYVLARKRLLWISS